MASTHEISFPLMTPAQAAEQLGHSEEWTYRGAQEGRLPHHEIGGKRRFCIRCLEEIARAGYRKGAEPGRPARRQPDGATARRHNRQRSRNRSSRSPLRSA